MKIFTTFMNILRFFSKTELFCINIILFIIVLFLGTIAQKDIGIQNAQEQFFYAKIIWIFNLIPFPGGGTLFFLIFIGLIIKLIDDKYTLNKLSTFFIHIGIIFFILAAFFTLKLSNEGTMIINEKENIDYFISKNNYSLILLSNNKSYTIDIIKNNKIIKNNIQINNITISVNKFYKNINLKFKHTAEYLFEFNDIPPFPESEYDRSGILLKISNENNIYLIEDYAYNNIDNKFTIVLSKTKTILPFSMELKSFNKNVYLQTSIAKSYESVISINNKKIDWKIKINMNKPFRLNGYTFYQTSFIENTISKATVLTVVKNPANIFFYIASFIIFFGLIYHTIKSLNKFKNE